MREIFVSYAYSVDYRPYEDYDDEPKLEDYNKAYVEEMEEVEYVLNLMKELYEPDDDDILSVKQILTDKLRNLRRYDEALDNEKYIQATYERKYGRESIRSVDSLWNIGNVYEELCTDNIIAKIEKQDPFFCIALYTRFLWACWKFKRTDGTSDYIEKTKILCDKYSETVKSDREYKIIERAMGIVDDILTEKKYDDIFNFEWLSEPSDDFVSDDDWMEE